MRSILVGRRLSCGLPRTGKPSRRRKDLAATAEERVYRHVGRMNSAIGRRRAMLRLLAMLFCASQSAMAAPPLGEPGRTGAGAVSAGRYGDSDGAGLLIFIAFIGVWIGAMVLTIKLSDYRRGPLLRMVHLLAAIVAALPIIALCGSLAVMALQSAGWIAH